MSDHKFSQARLNLEVLRQLDSIQNKVIKNVANAFWRNVYRIEGTIELIPLVLQEGMPIENALKFHNPRTRDEESEKRAWDRACKCLSDIIAAPDIEFSPIPDGVEDLFQSAIVGTWTAVEVCLEDLWGAANQHFIGKTLPDGIPARIPNLVQSDRGLPPVEKNRIKWRKGRESFRSLLAIRVAYSRFFCDDSSKIDTALSCLDLDSLALLRNVIVHLASKPDGEFRDQSVEIPALQKWCSPDLEKIILDGADVSSLIEAAVAPTVSLMLAVDEWVKTKS